MTLQQILYFIEIAHTQHFTQAAQNLYVSQSALSYAIQALERELEMPLFTRNKSGKRVALTVYGQTFLPYCEQTIELLKEGQRKIELLRNPTSGVVSIIYSYINCHTLVPNIFNRFYAENNHEDISVQFSVNHERAPIEKEILSGKADLGFACTQAYEGLLTAPIARQELVLYLPATHPLAREKKLSLNDIKDEHLICYYLNSNLYNWISRMFQSSGLKPNMTANYQDWSSHIAYVSLNFGITISPRLPVDSDLISIVEIDHPLNQRNVYMLWSEDKKLTPAAEYIKQYCLDWSRKCFGILPKD